MPSKKYLIFFDFIEINANTTSSTTKSDIGITVFKIVSLKFSIEIATNSAIKIDTEEEARAKREAAALAAEQAATATETADSDEPEQKVTEETATEETDTEA